MKYLAHITEDGRREQTVKEHSEKTAHLCENTMSQVGLGFMGKLVGLIHDAGKMTPKFTEYLKDKNGIRGSVHHAFVGAVYIFRTFYENGTIFEKIAAQAISNAVLCHHGRLHDCVSLSAESVFINKMNNADEDYYNTAMKNFISEVATEEVIAEMFCKATEEINIFYHKIEFLKNFGLGMLQKLISSALIDSDRYDTYCFMIGIESQCKHDVNWNDCVITMENRLKNFKNDTPINNARQYISDQCLKFANRYDGIYRLAVPTGAGKTLASLRFALNFANNNMHKKKHIFYVIPYTTILNQTNKEVVDICGEDMVLVHHSGVVIEEDSESEEYKQRELLTERWNAPIILTTTVQFLNSLFNGRSSCNRRMNALCDSVIIFDEVQALPKKVINLFNEAVNFLTASCGVTAVMCTATQPQSSDSEHSLAFSSNCDMVRLSDDMLKSFLRTSAFDLTGEQKNYEEIGNLADKILEHTNSVLIVMNTTKDALNVYNQISGCKKKYLIKKFCYSHKSEIIDEVKAKTDFLSKQPVNIDKSEKFVLVSTQLVEAGVDFSFGSVIRAMSGLDSFIQTVGRCNRSNEYGKKCNAYMIKCKEESLRNLQDIEYAANCTKTVIRLGCNDISSNEAVEQYYKEYFRYDKSGLNPMDYIIGNNTIMDMLSSNQKSTDECRIKGQKVPVFHQAFEAAGKAFSVIDNPTITVLVPYKKGEELITELENNIGLKDKVEIIKKSKQYCVQLYEYEIKTLQKKHAIHLIEDIGVYVLNKEFYDDEYGVITEAKLPFEIF